MSQSKALPGQKRCLKCTWFCQESSSDPLRECLMLGFWLPAMCTSHPSPSGSQSGQGAITDPEVVINVSHKHSFIVLRPLQVGWSLLGIGTVLSIKPLLVADNDFLLAVALQEADEELHHPQSSFPEWYHDQHLLMERWAALEASGRKGSSRWACGGPGANKSPDPQPRARDVLAQYCRLSIFQTHSTVSYGIHSHSPLGDILKQNVGISFRVTLCL